MGFFSNLANAAIKTAVLPVVVAADLATLGKNEMTKQQIEEIADELDDAFEL